MVIDFHTHAFPDNIARRAVDKLCETAQIPAFTDGTLGDLRERLKEHKAYGVLLPVATKPSQQIAINNWAAGANCGNIIAFGAVHPRSPDVSDEIARIKELGLKGIKIHPAYQDVYLFDDVMKPVFCAAEEAGLPVTIHMGYDPVCPLDRHAMPYHLVEIAQRYPKLIIIAAHLGGINAWREVLHYICGVKNIYLDTSFTAGNIEKELMLEIIKKHGTDKVLFGSDLPWHSLSTELEGVHALGLNAEDTEKILYKNAAQLLYLCTN